MRLEPGPDGATSDIFFVLIGAGQFINDYTGIKGRPNAKLYFDPSKGFNSGALQLHEHTRNSSGIGSCQEILLAYGTGYDLSIEPKVTPAFAARVKGPLAKFANPGSPTASSLEGTPIKKQKVADGFPPEAASSGSAEPSEPPAKKQKPEATKVIDALLRSEEIGDASVGTFESSKGVEPSGSSEHAAPSGSSKETAGSTTGVTTKLEADEGMNVVFSFHEPFPLILQSKDQVEFEWKSFDANNRKIAKHFVLTKFVQGKIKTRREGVAPANTYPYELEKDMLVMDQKTTVFLSLAKLVKENHPKCTSIHGYAPFKTPGVVPKVLEKIEEKNLQFEGEDSKDVVILLRGLSALKSIGVCWVMEYNEKACAMEPRSLVIVNTTQQNIKAKSTLKAS